MTRKLPFFSRWLGAVALLVLAACTPKEFVIQQPPPVTTLVQKYPNDDAIFLLSRTHIHVHTDGHSYRESTHQQIQALHRRGIPLTQSVGVPYNSTYETVSDFYFRVIRLGGTWISRNVDGIDQPVSPKYSSRYFSDTRTKQIATPFHVPSVEGAVMEYRYTKIGNSWMLPIISLQRNLPVGKAVYTVSVPTNVPMRHKLFEGTHIPVSQVKYEKTQDPNDSSRTLHRWEVNDVPAVPTNEPASIPWTARALRVQSVVEAYRLDSYRGMASSWNDIAAFYRTVVEDRDKPTPVINKMVAEITKDVKTQDEKIRAIYKFVNEKIRYIAVSIGLGSWQPQPAEFTLTQRYGDCKAKATLLKAMLEVIGVETHQVLVRTRDLGYFDEQFPADYGVFNHVINYAPGVRGGMYMDSTNVGTPFGYLPPNDPGAFALVVEKNKGRVVRIQNTSAEANILHRRLELTRAKTKIDGVLTIRLVGRLSLPAKKQIEEKKLNTPDDKMKWGKQQVDGLLGQLVSWKGIGFEQKDVKVTQVTLEEKEDSVVSQISFSVPTQKTKQRVIYVPMTWTQTGHAPHPILQRREHHPVFAGLPPGTHINEVIFRNWEALEIPAAATFNNRYVRYQLTAEKKDQYASYRREIVFPHADIPLSDHNDFRTTYEKILEADRRIMILRRGYGDKDKDGVPDNIDKCPTEPGPKELGGCPDRDGDGIIDKEDACPDVKGVKSDDPKKNGCPKVVLVEVTKTEIKILQTIFFKFGSATIDKRSFPVLDQVAEVLNSRKSTRVRVEGHTDNVGNKNNNLRLSKRRAASVKAYLIKNGVAQDRLESEGYGMLKPLVPNTNAKNRATNRRVQFNILAQ